MKKIFLLFIFLYTVSFGLNFSIAPTGFDIDLKKNETNEVFIINNTGKPLRIEIFPEAPEGYKEHNLNENITIFPKIISVKPGAKQTVRFRIKKNENLKNDGEYKSLLVFREKPSEIKSKQEVVTDEFSTSITFITEVAIGVYGHIGKEVVKAKVEKVETSLEKNNLNILATVKSEGNSSAKINYILENENGKKILSGKFGNSVREGKNKIYSEISLEKIKFEKLRLKLIDQNKKLLYDGFVKK